MADAPRYKIGTIEQMAAIPEEARGRFLTELPEILASVARAIEMHSVVNQVLGSEALTLGIPEWIDDTKGEASYTVTDAGTGDRVFSATVKMSNGGAA